MGFTALGLEPQLIRALKDLGYVTPTPIQQEAIPVGLAGRDVVGSAQTGTGKTAAFLLPILQRLGTGQRGAPRALVLVPTRELAEQVWESARAYGRHTGLKALAVYGGVAMDQQVKALRTGVDIVVATPGRLLDHLRRGQIDLSRVEVLVLDEADRMLDMGFAPDVHRILDAVPADRQTMFFSATVSPEVDRLAMHALRDPAGVEIGRRAGPAHGVRQVLLAVDQADKRQVLAQLLSDAPSGLTLVFTRTKHRADRLVKYLKRDGREAAALHGGKTQAVRTRTLDRFKQGRPAVLIATDVAARGIDVRNIAMVVNFDVPNDPEAYVHRVGRTARAGSEGVAMTLMAPEEWLMMRDVEKLVGERLRREIVPGFEPAVAPAQPAAQPAPTKRSSRSVRMRRGRGRSR